MEDPIIGNDEPTDELKKIIKKVVPSTANAGDRFKLPDNSEVFITEKTPEGKLYYKWAPANIVEIRSSTKKNILDTKTSIGASGTAGTIPIADYTVSAKVIVDNSKVDSDIVKITNENKVTDPIEWYTKRILRRV